MKRLAPGFAAPLITLAALGVAALGATAGDAQAGTIPVYQYKRFCKDLAKGHPVMTANCETQEVMSYNQLTRIWQSPPPEKIQDRCYTSNTPNRATGSGSYVKYLNCIITNMGD